MIEPLLVGIGGALGATLRFLVGQFLRAHSFPWATLIVNVTGSLILGVVLFGTGDTERILLIGVGFCGALTTFSSFSFETVALWEREDYWLAVGNATANFFCSLVGFGLGWAIVQIVV